MRYLLKVEARVNDSKVAESGDKGRWWGEQREAVVHPSLTGAAAVLHRKADAAGPRRGCDAETPTGVYVTRNVNVRY